ncbi:hypothetical protein F5144DRAFT_605702 [Chaetomium tenue]|uniref:Uncharacterized protein n=1 Tax=Chaetomium tenue TaxID=1854479 RepID=A0ACB7P0V7_9PEZI|nr:hypothetical protein F5144DRAFT_605702 [Chaetomium globosum]
MDGHVGAAPTPAKNDNVPDNAPIATTDVGTDLPIVTGSPLVDPAIVYNPRNASRRRPRSFSAEFAALKAKYPNEFKAHVPGTVATTRDELKETYPRDSGTDSVPGLVCSTDNTHPHRRTSLLSSQPPTLTPTKRKDVTPEHYYIETDYEGRLPPSYKGKKNGVLAPVMRPLPAVETAVTNGNDNDDEDENESEYEYANEFPWQVCNTVLPVHSVDQREPSPNQTLSYTAWTVNRLARQSGKEGLLWTILNKGGATYLLARVIKLKSRRNGAQVVFSALKFERHQQRTAIAAHVKLPQLNTDPCTGCASSTSTGPFSTCIQTGEFIGGCTNCQYHSKSNCSLRTDARPVDNTPVRTAPPRGANKRRNNAPVKARPAPAYRKQDATNDDDGDENRTCVVPFKYLPTAEIEQLVKEANMELALRHIAASEGR